MNDRTPMTLARAESKKGRIRMSEFLDFPPIMRLPSIDPTPRNLLPRSKNHHFQIILKARFTTIIMNCSWVYADCYSLGSATKNKKEGRGEARQGGGKNRLHLRQKSFGSTRHIEQPRQN